MYHLSELGTVSPCYNRLPYCYSYCVAVQILITIRVFLQTVLVWGLDLVIKYSIYLRCIVFVKKHLSTCKCQSLDIDFCDVMKQAFPRGYIRKFTLCLLLLEKEKQQSI
jgi:hypothetical protein